MSHVKGIDYLRAFAIFSVVIFHIDERLLPGGFLGVDAFFVISGFVVTNSFLRSPHLKWHYRVSEFFRRRIIRIWPALLVCATSSIIIWNVFFPQIDIGRNINATGSAALIGAANIVLMLNEGGYFEAAASFNPFTHFWSLGVEEQFYLLFPIIGLIAASAGRMGRTVFCVAAIALISFAYSVYASVYAPSAAFYFLPARAWQLLFGVGLRLIIDYPAVSQWFARLGRAGGYCCLVFLVVPVVLGASGRALPFASLVVSLACAGCIVWSVFNADEISGWDQAKRVGAAIGERSYSIYLWHWPIIVFIRWTTGINVLSAVCGIIFIAVLSEFSFRYVERPLIVSTWLKRRSSWQVFFVAGGVLICTCAIVMAIISLRPMFNISVTNDEQVWSSAAVPDGITGQCRIDKSTAGVAGGGVALTVSNGCSVGKVDLFIVGDSHAIAYLRDAYRLSRIFHSVKIYSKGSCRFLLLGERVPSCDEFVEDTMRHLRADVSKGDKVLIAGLYTPLFATVWGGEVPAASLYSSISFKGSSERIAELVELGAKVVLEAPKPVLPVALFRCADWYFRNNGYCASASGVRREEMLRRRGPMFIGLIELAQLYDEVRLWDPFPLLCPGSSCTGMVNGRPVFYDGHHLSGYGNDVVYDSLFDALGVATQ